MPRNQAKDIQYWVASLWWAGKISHITRTINLIQKNWLYGNSEVLRFCQYYVCESNFDFKNITKDWSLLTLGVNLRILWMYIPRVRMCWKGLMPLYSVSKRQKRFQVETENPRPYLKQWTTLKPIVGTELQSDLTVFPKFIFLLAP